MESKQFEFYEAIERWRKEKEDSELDLKVIEIANRPRKIAEIEGQEKQEVEKKSTIRSLKLQGTALIAALAMSFSLGIGAKVGIDKLAPVVSNICENMSISTNLAGWEENFLASKTGYMLDMEVSREKSDSLFSDGPMPYDYNDPENIRTLEDGRKVGALVDYYDAFDEYLRENTGTGYYETKYTQLQNQVELGLTPSEEGVYTYEELANMFEESKGMNK